MTRVTFFREGDAFLAFRVSGHSGRAPRGFDIVCAAITSAVRLAECQLNDVLKLSAEVQTDEERAEITIGFQKPNVAAQPVMQALYLYLSELSEEYPRFLQISEV